MNSFFSGAFMMGCLVAALFFIRFASKSGERIFAIFAGSFMLMVMERIILELTNPAYEKRPLIYLIRFVAFLLIIVGILDKNRSAERGRRPRLRSISGEHLGSPDSPDSNDPQDRASSSSRD